MRTQAIQQIQKSLDQMNIRVHHAVSDIDGKTGMAIVKAIVKGEQNPANAPETETYDAKRAKKR